VAQPSFLELTAEQLLDELGGPVAPAGGSALAFAVAMAAAVVRMAAQASKPSWDGAAGAVAQADALRARAAPLAELDAEALDRALAVRDGAASLSSEKRDWEIGKAFAAATEAPLEIGRAAADVAELAAVVAVSGEPRVRADAVAAAALAAAAARAVVTIVQVNLTALAGDPRVAEAQRLADSAEDALARATLAV
jgi:methenyltetrahydrofolate cyclohydrolase